MAMVVSHPVCAGRTGDWQYIFIQLALAHWDDYRITSIRPMFLVYLVYQMIRPRHGTMSNHGQSIRCSSHPLGILACHCWELQLHTTRGNRTRVPRHLRVYVQFGGQPL